MDYPRLSLWFLFIFNFLVSLSTSQPTLAYYRCSTSGNYTTNSTYAANLKELLSSIPTSSDLNPDGFFNTSIGQSPNQVYAIGLCRGGQTVTSCRSCLSDSILTITQSCPDRKEASGGYDGCRLMFSDHNIVYSPEYYLLYFRCNGNSAGNMAQFNDILGNLLASLRDRAAAAPRKYAVDEANYTIFQNIYGLAQCIPDVSEPDCRKCLEMARIDMTNNCSGRIGVISASSDLNSDGFFNASVSRNPDQVYPIRLCKGVAGAASMTLVKPSPKHVLVRKKLVAGTITAC
ncbi:hypothetical protein RJ640_005509 [Escallonia rubra]|uniref:Gnk2-homologous domain-containing protein n=1 Tax=Escallonia rubra TaxID=112253 RepID=A0AA88QY21_9ASTE|nr:hypothetical protein RJ640_005509 [Escallonia rubra]